MKFLQVPQKSGTHRWAQRFSNHLCNIEFTGVVAEALPTTNHIIFTGKEEPVLNPYFSKANVRRLELVLQKVLANLLGQLEACQKSGEIMPISPAYSAVAVDVITVYYFAHSIENLGREDHNSSFHDALLSLVQMSACLMRLPWLSLLINALPNSIVSTLMPGYSDWLELEKAFP